MMEKEISEFDLHVQYKQETGEWFQYRVQNNFSSNEKYSREYAKWIEKKYLQLLNFKTK